jgi:FixJ family two-component response regulator
MQNIDRIGNLLFERRGPSRMQKVVGIVDDDPSLLGAVDQLLRAAGYDTELFSAAEALLDRVETSKAACLVIDIHLGGISGIELARQLVALGRTLPIIFMSGAANHAMEAAAFEIGCIAFLHKPFPANLLLDAVGMALQALPGRK